MDFSNQSPLKIKNFGLVLILTVLLTGASVAFGSEFEPAMLESGLLYKNIPEIILKNDPELFKRIDEICNLQASTQSSLWKPVQKPIDSEKSCSKSPFKFTQMIGGIIQFFKSKAQGVQTSLKVRQVLKKEEQCTLENLVSEVRKSLPEDFEESASLEEFNRLRGFLYQIYDSAVALKRPQLKSGLKDLKQLIGRMDPYGKYADPAETTQKLLEIVTSPQPVKKVAEAGLISDFILDPKLQKKINEVVVSPGFKTGASPHMDSGRNLLTDVSYSGVRLKGRLPEVRKSVMQKLTRPEWLTNPRASALPYNADEAWILEHEPKYMPYVSTLLEKGGNRLNALHRVMDNYGRLIWNPSESRKRIEERWETGDIFLESIEKKKEFQGKERDKYLDRQRVLAGDTYHASLIIQSVNGAQTLNSWDKGIGIEDFGFGPAFMSSGGYRIRFDRLLADEHQQHFFEKRAKEEGKTLAEFFSEKKKKYSQDYKSEIEGDFMGGESFPPKYLITNDVEAREATITNPKNWFPSLHKSSLKDRAAEERGKALNPEYLTRLEEQHQFMVHKLASLNQKLADSMNEPSEEKRKESVEFYKGKIRNAKEFLQRIADQIREDETQLYQTHSNLEPSEKPHKEICSEFTLIEWVRYAEFLEKKLKEEYKDAMKAEGLDRTKSIFRIPFGERIRMSGFHPGRLTRLLEDLEKQGLADRVARPADWYTH